MPGLPSVARESVNQECSCSQEKIADQMCRQNTRVQMSPEEALAAEESLSIYCKPVELYNIIQRRASHNPSFLQRCLRYKIQAKFKRRLQVTMSLSGTINDESLSQNIFPIYTLLAKPVPDVAASENSAVYHVTRACVLTAFSELGGRDQTEATFIIPEIKKLSAGARFGDLTFILVRSAKLEGHCLWGKFPVISLCSSLEKCASLSLGHRVEMLTPVDMHTGILEPRFLNQENCIAFKKSRNIDSIAALGQVQVNISVREAGARERTPYDSYSYDDVPTSSLSDIIRLRSGNVIFNYRYHNNTLQKTEVTEDFTCPFCLVQCASFKGLHYHLLSCHDLFNFEFWVTEEYQAVNVSVKTDIWRAEIVADGVDPRLQTFFYCARARSRRRRERTQAQTANHVHPHVKLDSPEAGRDNSQEDDGSNKEERSIRSFARRMPKSDSDGSENRTEHTTSSPDTIGTFVASAQISASNDGGNLVNPSMLQFAKSRKLSVDRADPRNRLLLQKRQFFHSHRAQSMALEQVFSDQDSEDEVDDEIADFEDRRMLDDFVDVTKDEKHIMHLWNSFVRKQRVLADGHIPWACEAFSRLHGRNLIQSPALIWCWRLLMVKLWNHSLLDARSMNTCNIILERYQKESSDPDPVSDHKSEDP